MDQFILLCHYSSQDFALGCDALELFTPPLFTPVKRLSVFSLVTELKRLVS